MTPPAGREATPLPASPSTCMALKGAQHYNHSITILLQPGQHQLHSGSETHAAQEHVPASHCG